MESEQAVFSPAAYSILADYFPRERHGLRRGEPTLGA
jgi:hypothetical protein